MRFLCILLTWSFCSAPSGSKDVSISNGEGCYHIVDPAEEPVAALRFPFALNGRVVLRFVSGSVLFTGESSFDGLRTTLVPAEQRLGMALVMLAEVAASVEGRAGRASLISTAPRAIVVAITPFEHLTCIRGDATRGLRSVVALGGTGVGGCERCRS